MMDTRFTEIDASDVQKCFPKFYDGRGRFFEIVHTDVSGPDTSGPDESGQGQPIGFVGVRPLRLLRLRSGLPSAKAGGQVHSFHSLRSGQTLYENCELEVFIFKRYRNSLRKGIVLAVLDLPKLFGFKRCWMKTTHKTVVKLLRSMKKYNIMHVGRIHQKHVFIREFR